MILKSKSKSPDKVNSPTHSEGLSVFSTSLNTLLSGTILVVLGFAVGAAIALFDYFPFGAEETAYVKSLPLQWFLLATVAQTVFWAVAFGSMLPMFRFLKDYVRGHRIEIVVWSLLFASLLYSSRLFSVSCEYNLRHHQLKTGLLTYLGGCVAVIAGIGNILVNIGLREILTNSISRDSGAKDESILRDEADAVKRYLRLRGYLLHFLSLLGVMLGLVTLAQGAKRNLILSYTYQCESYFGREKVLVFGLYYTLILVLTFLPTFTILIAAGHKLRDDILPIPSPHNETWESLCAKREKLERLLALSMTEGLRAAIAILAPILGSIISLIRALN